MAWKMSILPGLLKQDCVYWPPGSIDKFGRLSVGAPRRLKCQWENKKIVATNPNGKTFEVTTQVFLSEEILEEGWLWLGTYKDKPTVPPGELKIKMVSSFQDVDNREKLWKALI
jgi:hypothetical protein